MRRPIVNGVTDTWRTISGIDFQQLAPYVLVAKPDRMRATWVWLRKDRDSGMWESFVTPAGAPVGAPIARDASAAGALAVAMGLPEWSREVRFVPTAQVPNEPWMPAQGRSYRRRYGDYPDRATAHDSRWDATRSGRARIA